jgi:hypothetical protein
MRRIAAANYSSKVDSTLCEGIRIAAPSARHRSLDWSEGLPLAQIASRWKVGAEPDRWDARLPIRWLQGETEKTPVFIIPVAFG